jgi:Tol biopolymer transport system component
MTFRAPRCRLVLERGGESWSARDFWNVATAPLAFALLTLLPLACARPPVVVDETFSPKWELSGTAPTTRAAPLQRNRTQLTRGTIGDDLFPSLTQDGKTLFFATSRFSPGFDLVSRDLHGHLLTSITSSEWNDIQPQPSPVNSLLAFASDREGSWDIHLADTAALEKTERLVDSDKATLGPRWSPDGKSIVCFRCGNLRSDWEIWMIDLENGQQRFLTVGTFPSWSPGGQWIAFQRATRNGEGWFSIWKIRVDGTRTTHLLASWSDAWGAVNPVWSPDGKWIAFTAVGKNYQPIAPNPGDLEQGDRYVVSTDGGKLLEVSADRPGISEWNPSFGRDWQLYFSSDQGGQVRIWSMATRLDSGFPPLMNAPLPTEASPSAPPEGIKPGPRKTLRQASEGSDTRSPGPLSSVRKEPQGRKKNRRADLRVSSFFWKLLHFRTARSDIRNNQSSRRRA